MIRVRVELLSAVTGKTTELARMEIANTGELTNQNPRRADYDCRTIRGRSTDDLDKGTTQRRARVTNWPRLDLHVWNLVANCLKQMDYTQT